ncbi:hypothetical protein RFI_18780 [Reticulomyxa filosa]|uniref:Uncharacterized protein n=1 Tax=Reticulomyxa filosa TaxID=46433 RepID=X6MZJ4_RETFI|nr:hypothetical protein RFI_18780 [Reticulomyxa filosa]|eukprot:ETO18485.1 hypothetical protein RFI_18780 [Reticulomyxa filosa]
MFQAIGSKRYWNILLFPVPLLSAAGIYVVSKRVLPGLTGWSSAEQAMDDDAFVTFSQSFFGGGLFAWMLESTLGLVELFVFFGIPKVATDNQSKIQSVRENNFSGYQTNVPIHIFLFLNSYFVSSVVEELTKALILQHCCKLYLPFLTYLTLPSHLMSFLLLGVAAGAGVGTAEAVVYVCLYAGDASAAAQMWLLLVRILVRIPFHSLLGVMWGMELSKREILGLYKRCSWIRMGWKPILFHGTFLFLQIEYVLLVSDVTYDVMGWNVLGAVVACILLLVFALLTCKDLSTNFTNMQRIQIREREYPPDDDDKDKEHLTQTPVTTTPISTPISTPIATTVAASTIDTTIDTTIYTTIDTTIDTAIDANITIATSPSHVQEELSLQTQEVGL